MRKNVAGQRVTFSLFKAGARIANPTRAAGDFKVDLDFAGQANVFTLPTTDAAGLVTWLPSQAETNAAVVTFLANDVLGAEWEPLTISFDTATDTTVATNLDAAITAIPAAVWAHGVRTLTSFGTLVADIALGILRIVVAEDVSRPPAFQYHRMTQHIEDVVLDQVVRVHEVQHHAVGEVAGIFPPAMVEVALPDLAAVAVADAHMVVADPVSLHVADPAVRAMSDLDAVAPAAARLRHLHGEVLDPCTIHHGQFHRLGVQGRLERII